MASVTKEVFRKISSEYNNNKQQESTTVIDKFSVKCVIH